jgi:hypothetical protein
MDFLWGFSLAVLFFVVPVVWWYIGSPSLKDRQ